MNRQDVEAASFWRHVDVREMRECWMWTGATREGYGVYSTASGRQVAAHRFAWSFAYGRIEIGKNVLHSCDVPACVNPRHLRLGTHEENVLDRTVLSRVRAVVEELDELERAERETEERDHLAHVESMRARQVPGGPDRLFYHSTAIEPLNKMSAAKLRGSPVQADGVKYIRDLYRIHGVDLATIAVVCRLEEWRVRSILTRTTWRHLP